MKTGFQVADAMTINLISVSKNATVTECANVMKKTGIGAVLVEEGEKSIGILTEKDIVKQVVAEGIDANAVKVSDFMKTKLITIAPSADIYDALIKMRDNNIKRLPVVENDQVLGLLTVKDILKIEPQLFDLLVEKIELREESRKPINRVILTEGICQTCGEYSEKVKEINGSVLCEGCSGEQTMVV